MAVPVRSIIVDAFRVIGDLNDATQLDGTRTVIGEQALNGVVAKLNLDNMFSFTQYNLEHTLLANTRSLSIGDDPLTPADVTAQRPAFVKRVYYRTSSQGTPYEVPLLATQDIPMIARSSGTVGTPAGCAYFSDYPNGRLEFDTDLAAGTRLTVCYNRAIPSVTINDQLQIPAEYLEALKMSLAYVLAVRYGKPIETVQLVKGLRAEFLDPIKANTQAKTPYIHHTMAQDAQASTIYSGGDW